jgi:hypothetical protein
MQWKKAPRTQNNGWLNCKWPAPGDPPEKGLPDSHVGAQISKFEAGDAIDKAVQPRAMILGLEACNGNSIRRVVR